MPPTHPHRSPLGRSSQVVSVALAGALLLAAAHARAQGREHAGADMNAERHMEMTPVRRGSAADSARATGVAALLRVALQPFADTSAAVAAGYRMFMPQVKHQTVYHFTNNWRAVQEAFRFDPARPTSLLYRPGDDGRLVLVGAMYTAPKRFGADRLDARVPLSVARWHKHVNWCVPRKGATERWLERLDGQPVFGPESPIATKSACDMVGGVFHDTVFGWMVHANVLAGDDPSVIWGDEHAGHDMHAGMRMGVEP